MKNKTKTNQPVEAKATEPVLTPVEAVVSTIAMPETTEEPATEEQPSKPAKAAPKKKKAAKKKAETTTKKTVKLEKKEVDDRPPFKPQPESKGFKFIPNFEHLYEMNKKGEINSLPRSHGREIRRIKQSTWNGSNPFVFLWDKDGKKIHIMVHTLLELTWGIKTELTRKKRVVKSSKKKEAAKAKKEAKKEAKAKKDAKKDQPKEPETNHIVLIHRINTKGETIATYAKPADAAKAVEGDMASINEAMKSGKAYKGYTWKKI